MGFEWVRESELVAEVPCVGTCQGYMKPLKDVCACLWNNATTSEVLRMSLPQLGERLCARNRAVVVATT